MKVRIDEARDNGTPRHLEQVGARADHRLESGELAVRENRAIENRDRVAFRMPEDYAFVKDEIGLVNRHLRSGFLNPPRPSTQINQRFRTNSRSIRRGKRLGLLNLHLTVA